MENGLTEKGKFVSSAREKLPVFAEKRKRERQVCFVSRSINGNQQLLF
jgi:hypothetical protein